MNAIELLLLAFIVESFVEYAFNFQIIQPVKKYIALVLGVIVAICYKIDILSSFGALQTPIPYVGSVISGLIIGRGSNYLNDIVSFIKK